MNPKVDGYLIDGCGRCPLGGTPDCKVLPWQETLDALRAVLLETDLTEDHKWSQPCYTYDGGNIGIMSALKDAVVFGFFKGVLLKDTEGVLVKPGPNSQAARQFKFTSVEQVQEMEETIKAYVAEAIEIEKAGLKVEFKERPEPIPEELQAKFDEDPAFEAAFEALTPGRQRSYIIHISGAKQAKTRMSRVEKCMPKVFEGKGFNEY